MKSRLLICLLASILMYGCGGTDAAGLKQYVENPANGISLSQSFKDVDYILTYRPTDLAFAYETGGKYTQEEHTRYLEENKDIYAFLLDINLKDEVKKSINDFTPIRLAYQNSLNSNLLTFDEGNKTYPCVLYHCETTQQGTYKINLLFEKKNAAPAENWVIRFRDPVTGMTPEFTFLKENLENIPTLRI